MEGSQKIVATRLLDKKKERTHNISYPASAAAVVFGVHLSAQSWLTGIDPDTSGQSALVCCFLRYAPFCYTVRVDNFVVKFKG